MAAIRASPYRPASASDPVNDLAAFFSRVMPIETPSLIVRRSALDHNLGVMQRLCDAAGVALRAHGKMHKCSHLARLQIEAGAIGLCCQTVDEAEIFASAGLRDLLITAPAALHAAARVAALSEHTRLAVVVDDRLQIDAYAATGANLNLVVDIDTGLHRAGCAPEDAVGLARHIEATPGLTFDGVQAYAGHLQHLPDAKSRQTANDGATALLAGVVQQLRDTGLPPARVTGGGTGTYAFDLAGGVFTELQAGSYAFMDVEYGDCGSPDGGPWPFHPALFVAATVVSARHSTHVTCNAGLKAVSVDGPPPRVLSHSGCKWRSMGDEHGAIIGPALPRLGETIWLQPGHIDPTVNLYSRLHMVDEDGNLNIWSVDARR